MMIGEFGQPETIYDGPSNLIAAVQACPKRFSPETHDLVEQLIHIELASAIQVVNKPSIENQ